MSRILLIEDETSTQNLLQNRLHDLGHEVDVAANGARGLMLAREGRYHLFLVDIGLGSGIDGFEVCRRLKAMPLQHSIPVVLISGRVKSQEDLHRGYEAGCESFLVKGDLTLMEDVVRAMLRIKSLQDDLGLQNRLLEDQNRRLQEERQRGRDLESALRESGSRSLVFRELAAGRPDGIMMVDGDGVICFTDRAARELVGSDVEGKNVGTLARGSGLEAFVRDARTEPREGYRFDLGHRSLSASVIPLVPRSGTSERPYKTVLLFDASRRRVAAEMLRMEEQGTPRREIGPLLEAARHTFHPSAIPGESPAVRELRARTAKLAHADAPVLISGEVGTRQRWLARALHFGGTRSGPFIPMSCSALDSQLLEQELFGFEKGAFPEALSDRPGIFQQADHGTVYLSNVDALSLELQAKLQGLLESGEAWRLGANAPERVNVRLITSTTADLEALVGEGRFRSELYYLLSSAELRTTPLRERVGDIEALARQLLLRHGALNAELRLSDEALWLLTRYDWPGNERELENCIEAACSVVKGDVIQVADLAPPLVDLHRSLAAEGRLPRELRVNGGSAPAGSSTPGALLASPNALLDKDIPLDLNEYERLCIVRALHEASGDKRKAARLLGMGKSTFYRKLRAHDIDWPREATV